MDCGTTASLNGEMNRLISYSLFIVSAASGAPLTNIWIKYYLSNAMYIEPSQSIQIVSHFRECL